MPRRSPTSLQEPEAPTRVHSDPQPPSQVPAPVSLSPSRKPLSISNRSISKSLTSTIRRWHQLRCNRGKDVAPVTTSAQSRLNSLRSRALLALRSRALLALKSSSALQLWSGGLSKVGSGARQMMFASHSTISLSIAMKDTSSRLTRSRSIATR